MVVLAVLAGQQEAGMGSPTPSQSVELATPQQPRSACTQSQVSVTPSYPLLL